MNTYEKAVEVVEWSDDFPSTLKYSPWPTYMLEYLVLKRHSRTDFPVIYGQLSEHGFRLKSVTQTRCGFLWTKRVKSYVFDRDVQITRIRGSSGSSFSNLETEPLTEQMKDQIDNYDDYRD